METLSIDEILRDHERPFFWSYIRASPYREPHIECRIFRNALVRSDTSIEGEPNAGIATYGRKGIGYSIHRGDRNENQYA